MFYFGGGVIQPVHFKIRNKFVKVMQRFSFYFLSRTSLSFDVKLKRGGGAVCLQIGVLVAPDTGFETQH